MARIPHDDRFTREQMAEARAARRKVKADPGRDRGDSDTAARKTIRDAIAQVAADQAKAQAKKGRGR